MPLIVAYRGPGAPPVLQSVLLLLLAAALAPRAARADPLACQPNEAQPMLPIFHIIGNVSALEGGNLSVEAINDASGVTYYNGIYHVWHQCCQSACAAASASASSARARVAPAANPQLPPPQRRSS